jgi:CheY-like chemotaxis protein
VRPPILYVEDDADTWRLTELRLRSRYELLWAQNDREACTVLREAGPRLHAVLMDIELQGSVLDGLKLVRLLRGTLPEAQQPEFARGVPTLEVPVLVLTAYTARYSEADALASGATHFLSKPIDFPRLTLALAQANIQSVVSGLARKPA